MTVEKIISQLLFWGIVIFSFFIWNEFRKSRNGKLRVLIMELFMTKCWAYGIAGLYYLLWDVGYFQDWSTVWLRIVSNAPMVIVMFRLYRFIKFGK